MIINADNGAVFVKNQSERNQLQNNKNTIKPYITTR